MLTPTAALKRLASRKGGLDLYVQEKKEDARYGFRIGELRFLLRPLEKVEVIEPVPTCPIPNTPRWFVGMINLRGNLLPVFDIKQLLGADNPEPAKWIMVFGRGSRAAGLLADTLPASVMVDRPADARPQLPEFLHNCVENIFIQEDNVWFEAVFEKMFLELRARF